VVSALHRSRVQTSKLPRRNDATLRYRKFGKDWRGSDGAKAKLNQINTFCMRLNCAQSKTYTPNIFFPDK
jgi:hypothetical protein